MSFLTVSPYSAILYVCVMCCTKRADDIEAVSGVSDTQKVEEALWDYDKCREQAKLEVYVLSLIHI